MGTDRCEARTPVLGILRQMTGELHHRLEQRFDAVAELADLTRRPLTLGRYASFYQSADRTLSTMLRSVQGLDYDRRHRAWQTGHLAASPRVTSPAFPHPANSAEALGLYYVVEGSSLGGRIILRELHKRGVSDLSLSFLDPYGPSAGHMWQALVVVLNREGLRSDEALDAMARGARRGFEHAEGVLCGDFQ